MKLLNIKTHEHQKEITVVFQFTTDSSNNPTYWQRSIVIHANATAEEVGYLMMVVGRAILQDEAEMSTRKPNAY